MDGLYWKESYVGQLRQRNFRSYANSDAPRFLEANNTIDGSPISNITNLMEKLEAQNGPNRKRVSSTLKLGAPTLQLLFSENYRKKTDTVFNFM